MAPSVKLAEYLFIRLHQLGVRSIYGVPGDFNLSLLDYVEPAGLHWIGDCNELNAGYASDGYARIKGLGALITTFGVGELSAINAIAGAFAEKAPVVHIVGTPDRALQDSRALVHHTFNDGDFRRFAQMHAFITVAQVNLRDPRTSPAQVDWALEQCLLHSRPVYIEIPADMVQMSVSSSRLDSIVSVPFSEQPMEEEEAMSVVLDRIYTCNHPMILVDGETRAFDIVSEVNQFVTATKCPTWTTVFGKGLVDETLPNVYGVYSGSVGLPVAKAYVDACDLIMSFGPHHSSTNTYRYSTIPDPAITISFTTTAVKVGSRTFSDLPAKQFLNKILENIDYSKVAEKASHPGLSSLKYPAAEGLRQLPPSEPVVHKYFWTYLNRFLLPGDVVLAETGTAGYGGREFSLPRSARYMGPATWLSIGYMLPAALGAATAQRELVAEGKWGDLDQARTVLFIGDGSLQMTVQAISTIIREKLNVVIFVINNDGYTIERCIHGWRQPYNDVAAWRHHLAPSFFGAEESGDYPAHTFSVRNWGELVKVLDDPRMNEGRALRIVEVFMDREDAPAPLLTLLETQKAMEKKMASS